MILFRSFRQPRQEVNSMFEPNEVAMLIELLMQGGLIDEVWRSKATSVMCQEVILAHTVVTRDGQAYHASCNSPLSPSGHKSQTCSNCGARLYFCASLDLSLSAMRSYAGSLQSALRPLRYIGSCSMQVVGSTTSYGLSRFFSLDQVSLV